MEIRELAERILFSASLEEKLASPRTLTDDDPGCPIRTPAAPGRPDHLAFSARHGASANFPGVHRLDNEANRGWLLHFFANHELLATELMALVLLKFPRAPAEFRRGILRTLQEEQAHTRLYLKRMKACGVVFGDKPVNGFFWKAVSGMEQPIDYVARLSLTFEQANLDYCLHFARRFREAGDSRTARLLQKIYQDEIGHVALGLRWFRHWKDPETRDWEAFRKHLPFPLSPARAKGPDFNEEGRHQAGLDPCFIDELRVHSQSKGRTPVLHWFNPLAECHIGHGPGFQPRKQQAAWVEDLDILPLFFCRQDDAILLRSRPSTEHLKTLVQAGIPLPERIHLDQRTGNVPDDHPLNGRKLGGLRPWAWSPDSIALATPWTAQVSATSTAPVPTWSETLQQWYSKAWSTSCLRDFLARARPEAWLCGEWVVGSACNSLKEVARSVSLIRQGGHHPIVVKEEFGLAGQHMIRLLEPEITPTQERWMTRVLDSGQCLVVEPWLDRVLDFSMHIDSTPSGLVFRGYTTLQNDASGQFRSSRVASRGLRKLPEELVRLFASRHIALRAIQDCLEQLVASLEEPLKESGYLGPVGIDALVYRNSGGDPVLKPLVEINPRYTMGRLAQALMKRCCPGRMGQLTLITPSRLKKLGYPTFQELAESLRSRNPVRLQDHPVPRLASGGICLNDPKTARHTLAIFQAGSFEDPNWLEIS